MAVSGALRRLLRVLTMEEDLRQLALESALSSLHRLERAQAATSDQERSGRRLVVSGVRTGVLPDRLAGLEETQSALVRADLLACRIADAESLVEERRAAFLAKRVECRQAETLLREAEARHALAASRRVQQGLDDWYLNRLRRVSTASNASASRKTSADDQDRSKT